jgi:hypothetical protein
VLLLTAAHAVPSAGKEPAEDARVFTNEDLAKARGNLTFTEPADDTSYEGSLPREKPAPGAAERDRRIADLKADYQAATRELERLEEELPAARDAAEREVGRAYVLVNGIPTAVLVRDPSLPAHERLRELLAELQSVQADIEHLEREGRKLGLGTPALSQK